MKTTHLFLLCFVAVLFAACESTPTTTLNKPSLSGGSTRTDTGTPAVDPLNQSNFAPGNTEAGAHAMPGQDGSNKMGGGGN